MTIVFYTPSRETREDVSHTLRAAFPKMPFLGLERREAAIQWMDASCEQPDVMFVDVDPHNAEDLDLIGHACGRWPDAPLVVLSPEPLLDCFSSLVYLQKPLLNADLVSLVHTSAVGEQQPQAGQTRLRDLLLLHLRFKSAGTLHVSNGHEEGSIMFERGHLTYADTDTHQGVQALQSILSWPSVNISPLAPLLPQVEEVLHISFEELLLEQWEDNLTHLASSNEFTQSTPDYSIYHTSEAPSTIASQPAQRFDEPTRGLTPVPVLSLGDASVFDDEPFIFEDVADLSWSDVSFPVMASRDTPSSTKAPSIPTTAIEPLTELSGFLGAAIVGCDGGELRCSLGGEALDLKVAAEVNAAVLQAKRRACEQLQLDDAVEEMLITLDQQIHILRPSQHDPDLFLYLVLQRDLSNVALARMALHEVEDALAE